MKEELSQFFGDNLFLPTPNNEIELTENEKNNSVACKIFIKNSVDLFRLNHDKIEANGQRIFADSKIMYHSTKRLLHKKGDGIFICQNKGIINLYVIEYKITIGSKTFDNIHAQWVSSCLNTLLLLGLIKDLENIRINWIMVGNIHDKDRQVVDTWEDDGRIYGNLLRTKKAKTNFNSELMRYNLSLSNMYKHLVINVLHIEPNSEIDIKD